MIQQIQIENLKARVAGGNAGSAHAVSEALTVGNELTHRVEKLVLVTEAMWELLSDRLGVKLDDLAEHVRQIDLRQGTMDGKRGVDSPASLPHCSACQAVIPQGNAHCQFCGAPVPGAKEDPFRI